MMSPHIVLQAIDTVWSKTSRGGEGARLRRTLPTALPMPLECFASPYALHHATFAESKGFERSDRIVRGKSLPELGVRDLLLQQEDASLAVQLVRDPHNAAVAGRIFHSVPAFSLKPGEWGQLQYNGRYVEHDRGNWWYEHHVYNIGLLDAADLDRFVRTKPDRRFLELARLW